MPLTIQPEAPPLRVDESGAVRVGNTRVLFVLVVQAFQNGATPEFLPYLDGVGHAETCGLASQPLG